MGRWKKDFTKDTYKPESELESEVISSLELAKSDLVLEIDYTEGPHTDTIAQKLPNGHFYGIHRCESRLKSAKAKHRGSKNITFLVGDGKTSYFPKKLDIIFSFSNLTWVDDLHIFFRDVYNNLKAKSIAFFRMPTGIDPILEKILQSEAFKESCPPSKFQTFHSRGNIEEALLQLPFRDILLVPFFATRLFADHKDLTHWLVSEFLSLLEVERNEKLKLARKITDTFYEDQKTPKDHAITLKTPYIHIECEK